VIWLNSAVPGRISPMMTIRASSQVPCSARESRSRERDLHRQQVLDQRASRPLMFCFASGRPDLRRMPTRHSTPNSSSSSKNHCMDPVASMHTIRALQGCLETLATAFLRWDSVLSINSPVSVSPWQGWCFACRSDPTNCHSASSSEPFGVGYRKVTRSVGGRRRYGGGGGGEHPYGC